MRHLLSFRHLLLALPLLAALLCTSCQRHGAVWPQLLEAEALLDTDLPAAASLLDSLDATPLRGEDAALYAILKTQADYKRYVPLTSDSLPRIATDYYGTPYRKNYHAAMAWYTLGCCYTDMHRTEDAFAAYLHAKRCFPSPVNRYYALCLQNIGLCYLDRSLYSDALRHFDACRSVAVALQDSSFIATCDYSKANCYLYLQDYALADSLYVQAVSNPSCNGPIRRGVLLQQAQLHYYGDGDAASALTLSRRYIHEVGNGVQNNAAWLMMGTIYASQNELDSAATCFARISPDSNEPYNRHEWLYQQLTTQLRQAGQGTIVPLVDRFVLANDSLHQLRNQAELISLCEDYDHELNESRLRHLYGSIVAVLLLLSIVLGLVFVLRDNRRHKEYIRVIDGLKRSRMVEERQRLQLERMTDEANQLKAQYEEACQRMQALETAAPVAPSSDTATLRALTLADYRERMDICARQFKEGDSWKLVLQFVHDGDHYLTRVERQAIVHDLNVCFTDFYEILLAEGQKMGQNDKSVAAGYCLGLRVDVMEEVLSIADNAIRARKSRMKSRLPADLYELIFGTHAKG